MLIILYCVIFAGEMKSRFFIIYIVLFCSISLSAQEFLGMPDAPKVKKERDSHISSWKIDDCYGVADSVPVDTLTLNYQDNQPVSNYSYANSWNGNLGSPLQSKLFFSRKEHSFDMFSSAYNPYTIMPKDVVYYDTNTPFSQLVYRTAQPSYYEEDYLKVLLTMNANKNINVGALCNYIYGRGQYDSQSSNMLNGGFWTAYKSKRYDFNASIFFNQYKNLENGGITDNNYILDLESLIGASSISPYNIPVNFENAQSEYHNYNYFYNHKYKLGRDVTRIIENDSVVTEFQPMISLIHTLAFEDVGREYYESSSMPDGYYANNYFSDDYTLDSTAYWSLKNTFAVTLEEDFNKLLKFGLSAFVEYDLQHYATAFDTIDLDNKYQHNLSVGGVLSKNQGENFRYSFNGKIYLVGARIGEFNVNGNLMALFNIPGVPLRVEAGGGIVNTSTYYQYTNYQSNHFMWENSDFSKIQLVDINGRISLPKQNLSMGIKVENITNYVYLNKEATPEQYDGNIQVMSIDLEANLKAWRFHLDTKAEYQICSNQEVLPLPTLALYSNVYYKDKFFNELTVQIGTTLKYHTAYYANAYMPALGQFYLQDEVLIGNYPEMSAYANFHLKTVRFYVQYYHWNKGIFGGTNYLSMPYYPINPATLQFGLSWTFWK